MRFNDRLTLRDSVEDLCDTVRDIVPHNILDEQRRERDTDSRSDEISPCMAVNDQLTLHEALDEMDEGLKQPCRSRSEHTYDKGEKKHQMLLADMAFPPIDDLIVKSASHFGCRLLATRPILCLCICRDPIPPPPR